MPNRMLTNEEARADCAAAREKGVEDLIARTAAVAADWWAERWQQEEDRAAFREEVRRRTEEALRAEGEALLEVDYDPKGILLDAIRAAGVQCKGHFFSARGLLPEKHETEVRPGLIEPKEGYGNWTDPIIVPGDDNGQ